MFALSSQDIGTNSAKVFFFGFLATQPFDLESNALPIEL